MATLDESLTTLRNLSGYKWDRKRAEDHKGHVKCYTFWFSLNTDLPNDIRDYEVRILVTHEGEGTEEATVYSTRHIQQNSHDFRDALRTKIDDFLSANPEYEKAIIESIDERNEYGNGRAIKIETGITTIINWVAFIKEGETSVTLRVVS